MDKEATNNEKKTWERYRKFLYKPVRLHGPGPLIYKDTFLISSIAIPCIDIIYTDNVGRP